MKKDNRYIDKIYSYYISKSKYKISKKEYRRIMDKLLLSFRDTLFTTPIVRMPKKLGTLFVEHFTFTPRFKEGKLIGLPPIDWKATKEHHKNNGKGYIRTNKTEYYKLRHTKSYSRIPKNVYFTPFRSLRIEINKAYGG